MPHIAAVATAVPPHRVSQETARQLVATHFHPHRGDVDRLLDVFSHAGIETRCLCVPPLWFTEPKTFNEKNTLYIEWCTQLGAQVVLECATRAGISPAEIDHLIFVSTTGLATPSIDARLVETLQLSSHIRRTPVWGLGCAGGASGLALACRLAASDPDAKVMLIAVELCSLTFHFADFSKSNFVATALFGDGAAGVLIVGDDVMASNGTAGPRIAATESTTWPGSLDVMGWNFDSVGMQVVFSRAIPQIVREKVRSNMESFLDSHRLTFSDLSHYIVHPGGAKVLEAYEEALPLPNCALSHARSVLRDYGNMSSPTVLFVLERLLAAQAARAGEWGILTALGPGFSAENVLLQF
ncbi:MAG: type III polyketide synthase [candidate division Zixibacteria bacterium]|nr:type III polyketide synthase [candidate division Zixibacteria bacterium]